MRRLRDALSDGSYAELLGVTDSETIFAVLLDRLKQDPGDLAGATVETVRYVSEICTGLGVRATLNLAVTDGGAMAFTRYSSEGPDNSLYFVEDGETFPEAVVVASERLNGNAGWTEVPERHLLVVNRKSGASLRPL
jgi:glutamine amidotransferase